VRGHNQLCQLCDWTEFLNCRTLRVFPKRGTNLDLIKLYNLLPSIAGKDIGKRIFKSAFSTDDTPITIAHLDYTIVWFQYVEDAALMNRYRGLIPTENKSILFVPYNLDFLQTRGIGPLKFFGSAERFILDHPSFVIPSEPSALPSPSASSVHFNLSLDSNMAEMLFANVEKYLTIQEMNIFSFVCRSLDRAVTRAYNNPAFWCARITREFPDTSINPSSDINWGAMYSLFVGERSVEGRFLHKDAELAIPRAMKEFRGFSAFDRKCFDFDTHLGEISFLASSSPSLENGTNDKEEMSEEKETSGGEGKEITEEEKREAKNAKREKEEMDAWERDRGLAHLCKNRPDLVKPEDDVKLRMINPFLCAHILHTGVGVGEIDLRYAKSHACRLGTGKEHRRAFIYSRLANPETCEDMLANLKDKDICMFYLAINMGWIAADHAVPWRLLQSRMFTVNFIFRRNSILHLQGLPPRTNSVCLDIRLDPRIVRMIDRRELNEIDKNVRKNRKTLFEAQWLRDQSALYSDNGVENVFFATPLHQEIL